MTESSVIPRSPGGILASARLRAGLSLSDIARRTRVPRSALEAIEADNWDALPGEAYARGFIRLYANAVNEDAQSMLEQFQALRDGMVQAEADAQHQAETNSRRASSLVWRRRGGYALAVCALITAILGAVFSFSPRPLEASQDPPGTELVED